MPPPSPGGASRNETWWQGQAAGELRSDVSADDIGKFLGVVVDGIVAQRALGFDPPQSELVLRFVRDATRFRGDDRPVVCA